MMMAVSVIATGYAGAAVANAFDNCVLDNMRGTTSDLAAKSIKIACLRKTSVDIPKEDLSALTGRAEYADFGPQFGKGFWIRLENGSAYIVTSVTIDVHVGVGDNQFFETDDFFTPQPGVIYAGPPDDPTRSMQIQRFSKVDFRIITPQPNIDPKKQNFKWGIAAAKGIAAK
ncbi:hypothetical protein QCM80_38980 [Bradyrhizobium sp. SSUT112]|uniref:hypothetical protein n=1 Tax=Bradyrhizobium sp. SSUT112 TaxID=3040604 RepID=UPI00244BD300|nr:hypothetical protein [Bradyrhizobium sp. SSUT112]MDH2356564.1 hypothetical protein [Bradyrhizobium sp. SSUT112]